MFGSFMSKPFRDAELGEFRRSSGRWKGRIVLAPCGAFRLSLAGGRDAPNPRALQLAKDLASRIRTLTPDIQRGLFEHYAPYRDVAGSGVSLDRPCPNVQHAEAVWPHVKPAHILIEPTQDAWLVEIAFTTDWDVEHTVAAIFCGWEFIGLNGSVRGQ